MLRSLPAVVLTDLIANVAASALAAQTGRLEALAAAEFRPDRPGGVVLIAHHGVPLVRQAFGMASVELAVPMRPDHVLKVGSITKEFTATAILRLVAEGKVALDDDVRQYVPALETQGHRVTIAQVLTHTGGLPNLVDLDGFETLARHDYSVDSLLALTRGMPLHFRPGTGFRYSDTGYILLGAIIERVSGLSYGEFLESRLFRPLGMHHTYYAHDRRVIPNLVEGYSIAAGAATRPDYLSMTVPHAAGAIASTADDLLRWHRALRTGTAIPRHLLERAWEPPTLPNGERSGYGFGFKLCTLAGRRTVEHGGFVNGFLAHALLLPDDGWDVIVLVNNDSDAPDAGGLARRLARYVLTGTAAPAYQTLDRAQRAALAGRYRIDREVVRTVFDSAGMLYSQATGGSPRSLAALSPTQLTLPDSEGAVTFTFELAEGRATVVRAALRCEPVDTGTRIEEEAPEAEPPG